jgi:hypothetical protein
MSSSDYIDALDTGMTPEEGSEYFVAHYIQEAFDKIVSKRRPDIAALIKQKSSMDLS